MSGPPPPEELGHAAAAVRPFRVGARTRLAVIVKATFQIAHRRPMSPLPPAPVLAADVRSGADPRAAILAAAEQAPYLPRADVLLTGTARARGGHPAQLVPVRLRVGLGNGVLLDKTLHVYGERAGRGHHAPRPFVAMPLGYERAAGGSADPDNPAGADPHTDRMPCIIDPRQPGRAAGFGPIAAHWPGRIRRLGGADPRAVQAPWPVLPDGFDWSYFQAAPPDQQTPHLQGREWVSFEGFHAEIDRVESWLPGPVADAWLHLPGAPGPQALPLALDMLVIDADRWVCSVVWRASAPLPGEAAIAAAHVRARVTLPGDAAAAQPLARPASIPPPAAAKRPGAATPVDAEDTMDGRASLRHALPFASRPSQGGLPFSPQPSPGGLPFAPRAPQAGLPFNPPPARSAPPLDTLDDDTDPTAAPALPFVRAQTALPPATPPAGVPHALPFARPSHPGGSVPPPAPEPQPAPLPEPTSPWAGGAARPSYARPHSAPVSVPDPRRLPAEARPALPQARRLPRLRRQPGERPPSPEPLIPPRKRRPAKVAGDGLGASFLRSAAP